MSKYKVFENEVDTYIAEKIEDCDSLFEQHTGDSADNYDWYEPNQDKKLTIFFDFIPKDVSIPPNAKIEPNGKEGKIIMATMKEWAECAKKPGFLCSTEY